MKRSLLMLASVMLMGLMLSSCTQVQASSDASKTKPEKSTQQTTEKSTEKVTENVTEEATQQPTQAETTPTPTEAPTDGVKRNSNTTELVTDFEYMTKNRSQELSYENCSYDDIVTCYIKHNAGSRVMHYLVDLKSGKLYSATNPCSWYAVGDYPDKKDLTEQEITDIKNALKNADTQSWKAQETGNNACCQRLSTILIEYSNGAVEEHSIACAGCGTIEGFSSVVDTICQVVNNNQCDRCGNVHSDCNAYTACNRQTMCNNDTAYNRGCNRRHNHC